MHYQVEGFPTVVVLNGEGSLYRDNLSAIRELFLAWLAKECLGIPTVFINGMVHLTNVMPVLPAMVRKTFRVLDAITVRDPCSLRNLEEYVPDVHAALIADSAFAVRREAARDTAAVQEVLGRLQGAAFFCFDPGAMPIDHTPTRRSALFELIARLKRELVGRQHGAVDALDENLAIVDIDPDSEIRDKGGRRAE